MSNPLLKPNDPRFQKPEIHDPSGKNRFGEGPPPEQPPQAQSQVYAAAATEEARPFVPRYEAQQQPRTGLLLVLGGLSWAGAALGAISLTGGFNLGWILPLLGIGPGLAAWFLGYEELKAIRVGAIGSESRSQTRYALWLGITALIACGAIVAGMIYRGMNLLPDVL